MIHDDYLRFLVRGERAEPVFYTVNVVVVPFSAPSFFFLLVLSATPVFLLFPLW